MDSSDLSSPEAFTEPPGGAGAGAKSTAAARGGTFRPVSSIPLGGTAPQPATEPTPKWWTTSAAPTGALLVAAMLLELSTFLTWVTATPDGAVTKTGNGWTNVRGNVSWGPLVALLAVVIACSAAAALLDRRPARALTVGLVTSIASLVVAFGQVIDIVTADSVVEAQIGLGIWLMLAAAAMAIASAGAALRMVRHSGSGS